MKILQKAVQRNVIINKDYYTIDNINAMLMIEEVFYIGENMEIKREKLSSFAFEKTTIRIDTGRLSELKVVLGEDGFYETVAIGLNGKCYHVEI